MLNIVSKKNRMIAFLLMLFITFISSFIFSIEIFANENDTIIREYVFEAENTDFLYGENTELEVGGKKYEASDITYEVIDDGVIIREIQYENLINKEIDESIVVNDENGEEITLTLQEVKWDSVLITRNFQETTDEAPEFLEKITTEDGYVLPLQEVTIEKTDYIEPFIIEGIFYGNKSTDYYVMDNGVKWLKNEISPNCEGYENILNLYLGLDENYLIQSGEWTSDYVTKDGEDVRYANFYGVRKKNLFTAYYSEEFFTGNAIYTNEGYNTYEVAAIVEYRERPMPIWDNIIPLVATPTVRTFTFFGALILILIAALLVLFKKRKRKIRLRVATNNTINEYF